MFIRNLILVVILFLTAIYIQSSEAQKTLVIRLKHENGTSSKYDLLKFINNGIVEMKSYYNLSTSQVRDKAVLILGVTGCGKSTLVNYLNDVPLAFKYLKDDAKFVIDPVEKNESLPGGFEIGHKSASKTLYPAVYSPPNGSYSFVDNPGFHDNRGVEFSIANGFFRKEITKNARELKFLILITQADINERGNSFRNTVNAISMFLGIFDDHQSDSNSESVANIQKLADAIGIVVTKVDNKKKTNEQLKKSLTNSLREIIEELIQKKIDEDDESVQMEQVFKNVLDNQQLEIFPGFPNIENDNQPLDSAQKLEILKLIDKKLKYISKEKAKLRVQLEDKVHVLKSYIDDKYDEFKAHIEAILVNNLKKTATQVQVNFFKEKNAENFLQVIENFSKLLAIINNEKVNLNDTSAVLANFTRINQDILSEQDLNEVNEKIAVFKYLIYLLPKSDVKRYEESETLDSSNLIKTLNDLSFQLNELLAKISKNETEKFMRDFQSLLLNKINQHAIQLERDLNTTNLLEPGKTISNTTDNYDRLASLMVNNQITFENCHEFLTNLTNIIPNILANYEVKEVEIKLNDLKKIISSKNQSYSVESVMFNKTLIMNKFQQSSLRLKKILADGISREKVKFYAFFEPFLVERYVNFVRSKLNDFDHKGYLDGEQQLNKIINQNTKLNSLILNNNGNVSYDKVDQLLYNISSINSNILTLPDLKNINSRLAKLTKLLDGHGFYRLDPLSNLIEKTNQFHLNLTQYLRKYREKCQIYDRLEFYQQYPTAFILLKSKCNVWRTLELTSEDKPILYNDRESTSQNEALNLRANTNGYDSVSFHSVLCSKEDVKSIIYKYKNLELFNYLKPRNKFHKRCFPNSILRKCGVNPKTENGMFDCDARHNGCCSIIHTNCCCYNEKSEQLSMVALHVAKRYIHCYLKLNCDLGWKC